MNTKPGFQQTFSTKSNAKRAIKALGEYAADMADEFVFKDATSGIWIANIELAKLHQEHCVKADAQETQPDENDGPGEGIMDDRHEEGVQPEANAPLEGPAEPFRDPTIPSRPAPTALPAHNSISQAKDIARTSSVANPCLAVWNKADEMFATNPHTRRKDVIAACVTMGIAFYTARTQYQQWLTVNKDKIAAAKTATI